MPAWPSSAKRCRRSGVRSTRTSRSARSARTRSSPPSSACSTTEYLRVGNQEYAKDNKSFGATTLLSRQVHDDGRKVKMRFNGKSGVVARSDDHRPNAQAGRPPAARNCRASHLFQYMNGDGNPQPRHVKRRQRLHPRGDRRRIHRQAFPHLGRERHRLRAIAGHRGRQADQCQHDDRAGRRSARQHGRDEPQVLRPPGADRRRQGAIRATRSAEWSGPAPASACRPPRSACSSSSRAAAKRRRKPRPTTG